MRSPRALHGFTIPEMVICAIIVASLFMVAAAFVINVRNYTAHGPGAQTQMLSNMKQLHLATQQAALDRDTTSNNTIGWPGDIGGSFTNWAKQFVTEGYLSTSDLCKLLSGPGRLTPPGAVPLSNNNAVLVYNVAETNDGTVVFLSSANFTNTPTGGLPPDAAAKPYGQKGFVIFHKAGDGVILQNRQIGPQYTNVIGTYVPLCH
ncbi:hypothetical protein BH09VER1_BH09VER1_30280 [soil metagenome]